MFDTRFLIRFFDKVFILKFLLLGLLISIVPIGEMLFILFTAERIGAFLILAIAAFIGLLGILVVYKQIKLILSSIKSGVAEGVYPEEEFASLAGAVLTALLFLLPGFITDVVAVLFLLPAVKRRVGMALIRNMDTRLKELYQYLKMY
ncbi:MAG: FxsA family protein [Spirochaetales bacterium]|nr:MAG: FxsA family protein [Spirochaetales bacterium]